MKRNKCITKYIYIEDDCDCPYYWTEDEDDRPCGAIEYVRAEVVAELRAQIEALKAALTEISEMGEGYATAMVITADKALDALRENQ